MRKSVVMVVTVSMVSFGCATENKNTAVGAGMGAAAGAIVGAVIGHQTGNRTAGAAVGAALGGTVGGLVGRRMDKQAKELARIAETRRTDQGLITKLKSDILFDTGKADLKPQAQKNLQEMAAIMKKYPENVLTVRGYTDSTGSTKVNEELSKRRADAVMTVLASHGVPRETISSIGMGPANPVADNASEEGRRNNRRVEIEITVDESKVPKEKK